jgi:hypothetical protein
MPRYRAWIRLKKVTGRAVYTGDVVLPDQLVGNF